MSNVASVKVSFIAFRGAFFLKATQLICTTIPLFVFSIKNSDTLLRIVISLLGLCPKIMPETGKNLLNNK